MGEIKPHLIRYWLTSDEKRESPETFAEKADQICSIYHDAPENNEKGCHIISADEMTGIQALERVHPDKPVTKGRAAQIEFEYKRHGTLSLIAFLDIVSGRIVSPYINETRTEKDFCAAIQALVKTDAENEWIFICDGLNTHKPEGLVRLIASQCGINSELGVKGKSGILKNITSCAEFLCDATHRIHFAYTPKHSSWLNQVEIWFSILTRRLLKRSSYTSTSELFESISKFIEQYLVGMSRIGKTTLPRGLCSRMNLDEEYLFVSREIFEGFIADGMFFEWIEYCGEFYGTVDKDVLEDRCRA